MVDQKETSRTTTKTSGRDQQVCFSCETFWYNKEANILYEFLRSILGREGLLVDAVGWGSTLTVTQITTNSHSNYQDKQFDSTFIQSMLVTRRRSCSREFWTGCVFSVGTCFKCILSPFLDGLDLSSYPRKSRLSSAICTERFWSLNKKR